jgi:hypothetical protein
MSPVREDWWKWSNFLNFQKTLRNKVRLRGVAILETEGATTRIVVFSTLSRDWRAAGMEGR